MTSNERREAESSYGFWSFRVVGFVQVLVLLRVFHFPLWPLTASVSIFYRYNTHYI